MKEHILVNIIDTILCEGSFLPMEGINEQMKNIGRDYFFYGPKDGAYPQYLLIQSIELEELVSSSEFLASQVLLFQNIKESLSLPAIDKNTSLLLLIDISKNSVSDLSIEDFILKVEEDPYFFKKLVLVYDSGIAMEVAEKLRLSKLPTSQFFLEQLNDQIAFDKFVNGNDPLYSLIAKLYIKLPFVKLPLKGHESQVNLADILKAKIVAENLNSLWDKVCSSSTNEISDLSVKAYGEELDGIIRSWNR